MNILILRPDCVGRYLNTCIAIATKKSSDLRAPTIERFRAKLSAPGSSLNTSMLRDLERGGSTEADYIVAFMLGRARTCSANEGMLAVAFSHLNAYEVRRSQSRA